jgi:hypothetical protein
MLVHQRVKSVEFTTVLVEFYDQHYLVEGDAKYFFYGNKWGSVGVSTLGCLDKCMSMYGLFMLVFI